MNKFAETHKRDTEKLNRYKKNLLEFNTSARYQVPPTGQKRKKSQDKAERTMSTRKNPLDEKNTMDISTAGDLDSRGLIDMGPPEAGLTTLTNSQPNTYARSTESIEIQANITHLKVCLLTR